MIKLATKDKCTGCAACYNVCGQNAINMEADCEGFLLPIIDGNKCIECHLCEKTCPILTSKSPKSDVKPKTYALWSLMDRTVSSSGGAFSAFSRLILERGGIVFGASFDGDLKCKHVGVTDIEGLKALRGSKYVQSNIGDSFQQVKESLRRGKYVLFCGTPCQIAGLKAYLRKDYDRLLTLDLACHGVPSQAVFDAYISKLSLRFLEFSRIDGFEFRQRDGWGKSPSVSLDGKLRLIFGKDNLYMGAFDRSMMFRKSCYSCQFAQLPRVGDCSIADFWGIGRHGKPFKHNITQGVSLVMVNNEKGMLFLNELKDVFIEERNLDEALIENHNLVRPSVLHPHREAIIKAFLNKSKSLKDIDTEFHIVNRNIKSIIKEYATKWHVFDFTKSIDNMILTKVNAGGVNSTPAYHVFHIPNEAMHQVAA